MKYIPSWFPGAGFKRKAAEWRALMQEFVDIPFEFVKKDLVRLPRLYLDPLVAHMIRFTPTARRKGRF